MAATSEGSHRCPNDGRRRMFDQPAKTLRLTAANSLQRFQFREYGLKIPRIWSIVIVCANGFLSFRLLPSLFFLLPYSTLLVSFSPFCYFSFLFLFGVFQCCSYLG